MKTERILTVIFFTGLFFRFMHWSGGNFMMILSLSSLMLVYFPLGFYFFSVNGFKEQNIALSIIGGWFLASGVSGVLFKIMYWPGANNMLMIGGLSSIVVLIFTYYYSRSSLAELKTYYKFMLQRLIFGSVLIFPLLFISNEKLIQLECLKDARLAKIKTLYINNQGNKTYRELYLKYNAQDSIIIKAIDSLP